MGKVRAACSVNDGMDGVMIAFFPFSSLFREFIFVSMSFSLSLLCFLIPRRQPGHEEFDALLSFTSISGARTSF
jgi:hypothetical protein